MLENIIAFCLADVAKPSRPSNSRQRGSKSLLSLLDVGKKVSWTDRRGGLNTQQVVVYSHSHQCSLENNTGEGI